MKYNSIKCLTKVMLKKKITFVLYRIRVRLGSWSAEIETEPSWHRRAPPRNWKSEPESESK